MQVLTGKVVFSFLARILNFESVPETEITAIRICRDFFFFFWPKKKIMVGAEKIGSVGLPETHKFVLGLMERIIIIIFLDLVFEHNIRRNNHLRFFFFFYLSGLLFA